MPNWKIHLEVGNRLRDTLGYNDHDFNIFMLGSILPDINSGFIVKNISQMLNSGSTHFVDKEKGKMFLNFYNQYKDTIATQPILVGYFLHLLVDYVWNQDFYKEYEAQDDVGLLYFKSLKDLKHNDFNKYNNKYISNTFHIEDYEEAVGLTKLVDRVSITTDDIKHVIGYLDSGKKDKFERRKYVFFNEEHFDKLLDRSVSICKRWLKKLKIILM